MKHHCVSKVRQIFSRLINHLKVDGSCNIKPMKMTEIMNLYCNGDFKG